MTNVWITDSHIFLFSLLSASRSQRGARWCVYVSIETFLWLVHDDDDDDDFVVCAIVYWAQKERKKYINQLKYINSQIYTNTTMQPIYMHTKCALPSFFVYHMLSLILAFIFYRAIPFGGGGGAAVGWTTHRARKKIHPALYWIFIFIK